MKKQLIFLYRYLSNPYRLRRWFNRQTLLVVLITLLFITTLAWAAPRGSIHAAPPPAATATVRPTSATPSPEETGESISAAVPTPTRTPLPPEYANNANETIGITFAGSILVLIVLIGMASFRPHWHQDQK